MKIDWKHLASTPGYRSLKAAYIRDVRQASRSARPMRDKAEFLRKFNWVIGRAAHYAYKLNKPIEDILTIWEKRRDYWWLNYYQDSNQPKFYTYNQYNRNWNRKPKSKKDPPRWPEWKRRRPY